MSLHPEPIGEVPEETARVAKACFPKGNRYIRLQDTLGTIFDDHEPPAHLTLRSPYDPQAHIGRKGGFSWYGYKVHLSETCDDGYPHLITDASSSNGSRRWSYQAGKH